MLVHKGGVQGCVRACVRVSKCASEGAALVLHREQLSSLRSKSGIVTRSQAESTATAAKSHLCRDVAGAHTREPAGIRTFAPQRKQAALGESRASWAEGIRPQGAWTKREQVEGRKI